MASRRDIREAFYVDLETAVDAHVPSENIGQEYPNDDEDLPAVVHTDNYRDVPMNTKASPKDVETDANGNVTSVIYSQLMEAQFSVLVVSDDEQVKEDTYEDLRTYFEEYEYPIKDATDLHADANTIRVNDTNSEDSEDRDPPVRGDRLAINVQFERLYVHDVDHIEEIQHEVDVDINGTNDITYTTS